MTDAQPETLTAEARRIIKAYRSASQAQRQWLFRTAFGMSNGLTAEQARRVAGPEPYR